MVTGGFEDQYYNDGLKSEIIDLENENLVCEDISNAPYVMSLGTGGFVNGHPVICGGFDGYKQLNICFVLGQNDILTLEYARSVASSIAFNNRVKYLFLYFRIAKQYYYHSSEIRGLLTMKCSSETLQNLLYLMYKKTHVVFFVFHFVQLYIVYVDIDQGIH